MLYWLTLLVVAVTAVIAQGATIAAWRARRATPRTVSLALSSAACVAILVAAADLPLPLPSGLCVVRLEPGEVVEKLQSELGRWSWSLLPCARLHVSVGPHDLAEPLDFARLAAIAVENGVVVDIALAPGTPSPGQALELVRTAGARRLPISTPIPASYTDVIEPRIVPSQAAPLCRVDRKGHFRSDPLHRLLYTPTSHEARRGFHLLECLDAGDPEGPPIAAYVKIAAAHMAIASSDNELLEAQKTPSKGVQFPRADMARSFGLDLVEITSEEAAPDTASMLVLDRPQSSDSCLLAGRLLRRGATVVVAMPGPEFVDACKDLLPIVPASSRGQLLFDRSPRVTYILDDFGRDLGYRPSTVFTAESSQARDVGAKLSPLDLRELQLAPARRHCRQLTELPAARSCEAPPVGVAATSDEDARAMFFDRAETSPSEFSSDGARLRRSSPAAALSELIDARSNATSLWENELLVVFTHDLRPHEGLDQFLHGLGARAHIVEVGDPYGKSLSGVTPGGLPIEIKGATRLLADAPRRLAQSPALCEDSCSGRQPAQLDFQFFDLQAQTQAKLTHDASWASRFAAVEPPAGSTTAPVRFGWWKLVESKQPSPVMLAQTTTDAGLIERPLAVGTMVSRGHLLFLAYSPFEEYDDAELWRNGADTRADVLGGLGLIEDLYIATEDLLTGLNGPVLSIVLQADGALWVTVLLDPEVGTDGHGKLDVLMFDPAIAAPLVEFDFERRVFTYAIPAAELEARATCVALVPRFESDPNPTPIYACPPAHSERGAGRMDAVNALAQLAYYTGGSVSHAADGESDGAGPPAPRDTLHTRSVGLGALSLVFLCAWGRRSARRLFGLSAYRKLKRIDQIARRRYDPPESVVAAAGDWDGRTSTWPRMGAFGGYRPLEPGDRASAIVLHDLVIREQEGTELLPRVALRIEEASPSVLVLVNLGESMRVPERAESGKALFSGRIGLHVAASAWQIRGEVSLHATGIRGDSEIIAPTRLSPGHEEIDRNLRARLRQRPARDSRPWPDEIPECGAVVYVSDFQLEDERALQAWLTELEGAGIRVGGVMVHDPVEFTMIEGGHLAGSGVWADRADWDPDDVFEAFSRRRDQIERIFDAATTGGLVVAATAFGQDDVELALEGGRLLQILR